MKQRRSPPAWFYLAVGAGMLMTAFVLAWLIGAEGLSDVATDQ